jgi:hypothetical protein
MIIDSLYLDCHIFLRELVWLSCIALRNRIGNCSIEEILNFALSLSKAMNGTSGGINVQKYAGIQANVFGSSSKKQNMKRR